MRMKGITLIINPQPDTEMGQKGVFCKGLVRLHPFAGSRGPDVIKACALRS
jgi:hypothetical protein